MNALTTTIAPSTFTMESWLRVRGWLLPAIDLLGGTHTETDVVAMLMARQLYLWEGSDAAHITEFVQYPRLREIKTFAAGGNKDTLNKMKPMIEAYGQQNGCTRAHIIGRRGWEREHPDYRFQSVSIVKDI